MSQQYAEQESEAAAEQQQEAQADSGPQPPIGPKSDRFYEYWDKFATKAPAPKVSKTTSLDHNEENRPTHLARRNTQGVTLSENATRSFEEARAACESKVDAIIKECRRLNVKYNDPAFRLPDYDTLASLAPGDNPDSIDAETGQFSGSVKRIEDIFDDPKFVDDGATADDVRQGRTGDCWFLAAVTALSGTEGPKADAPAGTEKKLHLLEKLFVKQDEKVGVYGFVFFRDGEWISEVVDDRLCLVQSTQNIDNMHKRIRPILTRGSDALYFGSCRGSNETWLPLLEKAFAKAHGDYQTIEGGVSGEGIEDLTGGVNVSIDTEDILDKDVLWDELKLVNKKFLFGCSSRRGMDSLPADDEGFVRGHAYTVLEARELDGWRLLRLKNPWGNQEWNGAWSDGSKEWTAARLSALGHTFGDDGIFWISLKDFLQYYRRMDRTRLFDSDWTVCQQWTTVEVPYNVDYSPTTFKVNVKTGGPLVIVLAQPDQRYFAGLEGRYFYDLHFRLYRDGEERYLLRSMAGSGCGRSCNAELDVEPGTYTVMMKIKAVRADNGKTREGTIKDYRRSRKDKLLAIGHSFDDIHSKGLLREAENGRTKQSREDAQKLAKDRRTAMMKAERVFNKEAKRRQKGRVKRIDEAVKAKVDAKRAARIANSAPASAVATPASVYAQDEEATANGTVANGVANGVEAPVTPPPEPVEARQDAEASTAVAEDADDETAKVTGDEATDTAVDEPEAANEVAPTEIEEAPEANGEAATAVNEEDVAVQSVAGYDEPQEAQDPAGGDEDDDENVSAAEDDDFDWDSDIDDPVPPIMMPETVDDDDDIFAEDPWNALCVVGLRVYSKGTPVRIIVVKGVEKITTGNPALGTGFSDIQF